MRHLKKYEGFKDWFKKSPKKESPRKEEEKSVIFNTEKSKEKIEEDKRLEYNSIDDVVSKLNITSIESIEKIDIRSNEWVENMFHTVPERIYHLKPKREFVYSKVNNEINLNDFKALIGDVHLLLHVSDYKNTMTPGGKYYIGIYLVGEINDVVNEKRAAPRKMRRFDDDFMIMGSNTIGVEYDRLVQCVSGDTTYRESFESGKASLKSDYLESVINVYLIDKFSNSLSILFNRTNTYNNQMKLIKKRKRISSNVEEIKTFFYDISDIVEKFHIEADDFGVIAVIESKHINIKNTDDGDFKLTDKILDIFESLREVKSRLTELIPDSEITIRFSSGKIVIKIR